MVIGEPTVSFQIAIGGASNGYCQISALAEVTILPAAGVVPSLAPPDRTIVVSVVRSPAGFLFPASVGWFTDANRQLSQVGHAQSGPQISIESFRTNPRPTRRVNQRRTLWHRVFLPCPYWQPALGWSPGERGTMMLENRAPRIFLGIFLALDFPASSFPFRPATIQAQAANKGKGGRHDAITSSSGPPSGSW